MPRKLQSKIHSEKSISSSVWNAYKQQIINLWNASQKKGDFNDHLIREYNRKIDNFNQNNDLFIAPFDSGYRFIGQEISSGVLTITGFAYPNETLTAPAGSTYQWYVNDIARGNAQTLILDVNDIGLTVRCVVGAAECTPVTVWHPNQIASVKAFFWATRSAYNVRANGVTDENASIDVVWPVNPSYPDGTPEANGITRGSDQFSKAHYGDGDNSADLNWCGWDGNQWILNVFYYNFEDIITSTFTSPSNTTYPWQATWPAGVTVTRQVTTVDTLATDGQTVDYWRDIISGQDATASSVNIAYFEDADLPTPSLKFDANDFFRMNGTSIANVFNSQNNCYIFAGAKDTAITGNDVNHGIVSINRSSGFAKVALLTRNAGSSLFVARALSNNATVVSSTSTSNSDYNVLTNESLFSAGSLRLRVNGSQTASSDISTTIPDNTSTDFSSYIGAHINATTSNFNGYMTAIILAADSSPMSDTDRSRIERFIGLLGELNISLV